jgi:hypothetical protein
MLRPRFLLWTLLAASTVAVMCHPSISSTGLGGPAEVLAADRLIGRAVLPAATFAPGPTSGSLLGSQPINGQEVPFVNKQPVQGFSAVLDNGNGTFLAMSDNGFGSLENSADFHLRVYTIRPEFLQHGKRGSINSGDIQSFDFRSLLVVQEQFPQVRPVYLFGDFPIFADSAIPGSDDGTNLQDEHGHNTPWLAGLFWPYRVTTLDHPFRSQRSGGFEGMALSQDGSRLLPLLENL